MKAPIDATATRVTDTPAHRALHKRFGQNTRRIAKAEVERRAAYDERRVLYAHGRTLNPPESFIRMASMTGVTEAAVIQAINALKRIDEK